MPMETIKFNCPVECGNCGHGMYFGKAMNGMPISEEPILLNVACEKCGSENFVTVEPTA